MRTIPLPRSCSKKPASNAKACSAVPWSSAVTCWICSSTHACVDEQIQQVTALDHGTALHAFAFEAGFFEHERGSGIVRIDRRVEPVQAKRGHRVIGEPGY